MTDETEGTDVDIIAMSFDPKDEQAVENARRMLAKAVVREVVDDYRAKTAHITDEGQMAAFEADVRDAMITATAVMREPGVDVLVFESDNGDEDWVFPVCIQVIRGLQDGGEDVLAEALLDLSADAEWDEQVTFAVEQLRESL